MNLRLLSACLGVALLSGCGAPGPAAPPAPTTSAPTASAPTTSAPTTSAGAPVGIVEGADPEVDAVVTAWTTVFDSAVPVPDKLVHLAEPAVAEPVLAAYADAGAQVGGISLEPTDVTVDGDTATVVYDVLFGGTVAYSGQDGTVNRTGDGWVVPTDRFCSFMAAARTPC